MSRPTAIASAALVVALVALALAIAALGSSGSAGSGDGAERPLSPAQFEQMMRAVGSPPG